MQELKDLEIKEIKQRVDFLQGYMAALKEYAWWKDGTQYVGAGLKTLKMAMEPVKNDIQDIRIELERRGNDAKEIHLV